MRAQLYAADVVLEERALEDGSLELRVQLPAAALATWAAQPGVQLIGGALPGPGIACAPPGPYLESIPAPKAGTVVC